MTRQQRAIVAGIVCFPLALVILQFLYLVLEGLTNAQ